MEEIYFMHRIKHAKNAWDGRPEPEPEPEPDPEPSGETEAA